MKCSRCGNTLEEGESREHAGHTVCEDCYMEVLNPPQPCDPWAVHLAKSDKLRTGVQLTPLQQQLYELVKKRGAIPVPEAAQLLGLSEAELRREFATLRHLELLRGQKQGHQVLLTLF